MLLDLLLNYNERLCMKITKMPYTIEVDDYHEFEFIRKNLNDLIRGIKVEEVTYLGGVYLGIVYHKTTNKSKVKNLKAKLVKMNEEDLDASH